MQLNVLGKWKLHACAYFSLHHSIFESEKFRFPFSTKISLTWEVKCEKLNPENRREFITEASKIVPESGKQAIENYRRYLYFSE